jgi:NAD(P)-dependent dehydrogenase (short-subunit alcohol dehydrogenase family)
MTEEKISSSAWDTCLCTLQTVIENPEQAPELETIERLAAQLYKQARKRQRKAAAAELTPIQRKERQMRSHHDRKQNRLDALNITTQTGMALVHKGEPLDVVPNSYSAGIEVRGKSKSCYCCGAAYRKVHFFYHLLCPQCAEFNYAKRFQRVDLTGRYALVTGGRIKIGFQTALNLLRDGANVMVITRFSQDAAQRFAAQADFEQWHKRLSIQKLDFLDLPGVLDFIQNFENNWPALDILINNAAQTVWRPPEFYTPALQMENTPLEALPKPVREIISTSMKDISPKPLEQFQSIPLDRHGQPVDKREKNSWTIRLHELEGRELLEVLLINSAAPCLLTAKLKPLLLRSPYDKRFIINVCGQDGQFNRSAKTTHHPHVNMSKAALNMLTHTVAADYVQDGVYMNSVDTGWITHEGGYSKREQMHAAGFVPPLDEVDGAARIYDPIVQGITGTPVFGKLLRNYQVTEW